MTLGENDTGGSRGTAAIRIFVALALSFLVAGICWQRIDLGISDTPPVEAWGEATYSELVRAAEGSYGDVIRLSIGKPEPGLFALRAFLLKANGQWDYRLEVLLGSVPLLAALGGFAWHVQQGRGSATRLVVGSLVAMGIANPYFAGTATSPDALGAGWTALIAWGTLAVPLSSRRSRAWACLGCVLACAFSHLGGAVALALAVVSGRQRHWRMAVLLSVIVGTVGIHAAVTGAFDLPRATPSTLILLFLCAPILAAMLKGAERNDSRLAWAFVLSIQLLFSDSGAGPWLPFLLIFAGDQMLGAGKDCRTGIHCIAGGAWLVALTLVTYGHSAQHTLPEDGAKSQRERTRLFRELRLDDADVARLANQLGAPRQAVVTLRHQLSPVAARRWLPVSLRDAVHPGLPQELKDGAPGLIAQPFGLPIFGTWRSTEAGIATGEWTGTPITTDFSFLQFHIAGEMDSTLTWLELHGDDGKVSRPFESRVVATEAWRRINLPVPGSHIAVRMHDGSPDAWIAAAGPVELGMGSWLAGKIVSIYPALLWSGVVLLASGWTVHLWREAKTPSYGFDGHVIRMFAGAAIAAFALAAYDHIDNVAAGSDAAGYRESARVFGEGRITVAPRTLAGFDYNNLGFFAPLGFVPRPGNVIVPTYPSGLPLLYAAAGGVFGLDSGVSLVIWLHLMAGGWVVWQLAREAGLGSRDALAAVLATVLTPVGLYLGLQPMSDLPSMVWLSFALLAAVRGRTRLRWAIAAGAASAFLVVLRPANAIALLPIAVCMGRLKPILGWIAGAVPGACWQLFHAWTAFGHPLATGYGDTFGAFSVSWIGPTLAHFYRQLPVNFTPLVWAVLLAPRFGPSDQRLRWSLLLTVGAYVGFYAAYSFTHETWWYLRFILPAFPAIAILCLTSLKQISSLVPGMNDARVRSVVTAALLAIFAGHQAWRISRLGVLDVAEGNRAYLRLVAALESNAPPTAAVFALQASATIHHYTNRVVLRFDQVETETNQAAARYMIESGRGVYAILFPFDIAAAGERLPKGHWTIIETIGDVQIKRLDSLLP